MTQEQKKPVTIYSIIIAILLFLLVIETGILISKSDKPEAPVEKITSSPEQEKSPAQLPSDAAQPVPQPPVIAYDPFTPSPYLRRAHRPRTQADPISSFSDMDDPFYAMEKIQERMNRLFDTAMLNSELSEPNLMNNLKNSAAALPLEPPADIQDDGKNYIIKSDMPGLEKDKINITVEGDSLSITGTRENVVETKDDATGYVSRERSYGSFSKSMTLPGSVDETKVFADYKNGVLTIRLPKIEAKKSQQKVTVQ